MKLEIDYEATGKRIRECRMNKDITQDALAELIEVNPSFISNIERAKTKMSTETLANIAKSLNTSIDYLLFGDIELDNNQYSKIAVLEIQEILKDKSKNEVDAFMSFCNNFVDFLKKIEKW